jgi:hypothetical protein
MLRGGKGGVDTAVQPTPGEVAAMYGAQRFLPLAGLAGVLVLATVLGPIEAPAQNLVVGPFRILPSVAVTEEFDDNVDLTPNNEDSDFITIISPGIIIELPARRYSLRVGYRADIERYAERTDLDTVNHTALVDGRVSFPWGLTVTLSNTFLDAFEFPGFPLPEVTRRVERYENLLMLTAEYRITERIASALRYSWLLVDYLDDPEFEQQSRQEHQIGFTVSYRIFPKTSVLGEYDYQIIRYDETPINDSDSNKFRVGLLGDLTAKTSVTFKVGAEIKDYDTGEDWTGPIFELAAVWKYRDPSQLRIFASRSNVESLSEGENFYVSTFGGVEARHYLNPRLFFSVTGLIGANDYPEPVTVGAEERLDYIYEVRALIHYQFRRWLSAELAYAFLVRDSNFNVNDYTNNRVSVGLRFSY